MIKAMIVTIVVVTIRLLKIHENSNGKLNIIIKNETKKQTKMFSVYIFIYA